MWEAHPPTAPASHTPPGQAGLAVIEVSRPDKAERRRIGKSDPIDAYPAARAVVSGRATSAPKDGTNAGKRALQTAVRTAIKAGTATLNQMTRLLITAPDAIRAKCSALSGDKRVTTLARFRPAGDPAHGPLLTALRTLAKRVRSLTEEHTVLTGSSTSWSPASTPACVTPMGWVRTPAPSC
ncbi:hypothetical protein ACFCXT_09690 [Streptomyces vinaceus]|uniref:hypothetical protein n=1 Tax=Streptomyces vinaceus TaxID=1960 RepID=UPI0035DF8837